MRPLVPRSLSAGGQRWATRSGAWSETFVRGRGLVRRYLYAPKWAYSTGWALSRRLHRTGCRPSAQPDGGVAFRPPGPAREKTRVHRDNIARRPPPWWPCPQMDGINTLGGRSRSWIRVDEWVSHCACKHWPIAVNTNFKNNYKRFITAI